MMASAERSPDAFEELHRFLSAHRDRGVLISAEGFAVWLSRGRLDVVLKFVAAAREVMPVRFGWTVRRCDEVLTSAYLLRLGLGADLPPPAEYFNSMRSSLAPLFAGMSHLERVAEEGVSYVRYEANGGHNGALLRSLDLSDGDSLVIEDTIRRAPRRNVSLTHKQAVAMANTAALSERAAVALDREAMRTAFWRGGLRFEDDRRCELVDAAVKESLHRVAHTAAAENGIPVYAGFFENEEIVAEEPVGLDLSLLDDADVRRIAAHPGVALSPPKLS